jgi:hypothetical protein
MCQVFRKLSIGSRVEPARTVVEQTQLDPAQIPDLPAHVTCRTEPHRQTC